MSERKRGRRQDKFEADFFDEHGDPRDRKGRKSNSRKYFGQYMGQSKQRLKAVLNKLYDEKSKQDSNVFDQTRKHIDKYKHKKNHHTDEVDQNAALKQSIIELARETAQEFEQLRSQGHKSESQEAFQRKLEDLVNKNLSLIDSYKEDVEDTKPRKQQSSLGKKRKFSLDEFYQQTMKEQGSEEVEMTTAATSSGTTLPKREADLSEGDMEDSTDTENTKAQLHSDAEFATETATDQSQKEGETTDADNHPRQK